MFPRIPLRKYTPAKIDKPEFKLYWLKPLTAHPDAALKRYLEHLKDGSLSINELQTEMKSSKIRLEVREQIVTSLLLTDWKQFKEQNSSFVDESKKLLEITNQKTRTLAVAEFVAKVRSTHQPEDTTSSGDCMFIGNLDELKMSKPTLILSDASNDQILKKSLKESVHHALVNTSKSVYCAIISNDLNLSDINIKIALIDNTVDGKAFLSEAIDGIMILVKLGDFKAPLRKISQFQKMANSGLFSDELLNFLNSSDTCLVCMYPGFPIRLMNFS